MNQKTKKHSETAERIMLFIGAASLLLAFCICFGCTGNSSAKTLQQLFDEISSTGKMAALTAVPTEDYLPVFGIETEKVEDSVFYIAETHRHRRMKPQYLKPLMKPMPKRLNESSRHESRHRLSSLKATALSSMTRLKALRLNVTAAMFIML